ncbi:MAG: hypothetical protein AAFU64_13245 [Bacteroidota bacterium]
MEPLPKELFKRMDENPDELFYQMPRFVTHIDESAISAVTNCTGNTSLPWVKLWI